MPNIIVETKQRDALRCKKECNSPQLVQGACGGWLALSGKNEPIKIGVVAETEDTAKAKFKVRIAAWRETSGQARI